MRVLDSDELLQRRGVYPQQAVLEQREIAQSGTEAFCTERREIQVVLNLPPFPQAATRLMRFFRDIRILLQEDLHDLWEPLLVCQAHADTEEQRATITGIANELACLDRLVGQSLEAMGEHWQKGANLATWQRSVEETAALLDSDQSF